MDEVLFYAWLVAGVVLLGIFRIFSPAALRRAPARRGTLSIPVVGGVLVLYLIATMACAGVAAQAGWLHLAIVSPAASAPASQGRSAASAPTAAVATQMAPTEAAATQAAQDTEEVAENLVNACGELIAVGVAFFVVGWLFTEGYRGWGLHVALIPVGIVVGLLGFFAVYPILAFVYQISIIVYEHFGHQVQAHPAVQLLEHHGPFWQQMLTGIQAVCVAPVIEEIFFRGLLQTSLIQFGWGFVVPQLMPAGSLPSAYRPGVMQRWVAILLTSAAFSYVHPADHVSVIFLLSVALGYVYERTGNLWASITLHAAFNAMTVLPLLFASAHS